MQRDKKLYITIFDYNKRAVCDLYDNRADISGQAVNVHITTERNGWKELSFDIPSTCMTENGEEENYRLKYLVAEYKIRVVEEGEIDWYIISEPKINRNNFSKNVSVRAGHISQLLKHKNLDLEFSDDEGNNVGTAEQLLTTILEGTGWSCGLIDDFKDTDGSIKHRSITGQAGTGALSFIESLCDAFEAKPVYHGDSMTVDILQMNPFAYIQPEQIPTTARDQDLDVIELHYGRNVHTLAKTFNTDNIATRLYAYGSSGDMNGMCSLQNAEHLEWAYTIPNTEEHEFCFTVEQQNRYFDIGDNDCEGYTFIWSNMDLTSMSYVYCEETETAYRVYDKPKGSYELLADVEPSLVLNEFPYLLGLNYYDDVGLMNESQFQEVAKFQRKTPREYQEAQELSKQFIEGSSQLSKIAENNTGMLKLKIASVEEEPEQGTAQTSWPLKFTIDTTAGEHGVIYRTDYDVAERRYFKWHVTDKLKANGDPVKGTPSIVFFVHNTNPVTFDSVYLKRIYDSTGELVKDEDNNPMDFTYSTGDFPTAFTVWSHDVHYQTDDKVYLFCTNSMSGLLGARLSTIEALHEAILKQTQKHPVIFRDADRNEAIKQPSNTEYEWRYDYHCMSNTVGELYFVWKNKFDDVTWHRVYTSEPAEYLSGDYWYNMKTKKLYHAESGWVEIEDKLYVVRMFESVMYYCQKHDKLYQGIYGYYRYNGALPVGNYAIYDGYDTYWTFKLLEAADQSIELDYTNDLIHMDGITEKVVSVTSVETTSAIYPAENELEGKGWYEGSINVSTGVEEDGPSVYISDDYQLPLGGSSNDISYLYYSIQSGGSFTVKRNNGDTLYIDDSCAYGKVVEINNIDILEANPSIKIKINNLNYSIELYEGHHNELRDTTFADGAISYEDGSQIPSYTQERSDYIQVIPGTYTYMYPENSSFNVAVYDYGKGFKRFYSSLSGHGTFTVDYYGYIRIVKTRHSNKPYIGEDVIIIPKNNLVFTEHKYRRTGTVSAYENTTYSYCFHGSGYIYYYDINLNYLGYYATASNNQTGIASGNITTKPNTRFMRFVVKTEDTSGYIYIQNYDSVFYLDREQYKILSPITTYGEQIGIYPLTKKFSDIADETYEEYLITLKQKQADIKDKENRMSVLLGDMLKDGRWKDSNYISGDEKRLYDDALYMHRQVSVPEVTYSFTYLDMYGVKNEHYYETHKSTWPDINILFIAHLIDEESNTNCWAYIDKIDKCYDKPWETSIEIDTKLTLAARHGFTDVISRIAEVAKDMKTKQAIYDQVVTGQIDGSRVEGTIALNQAYLNGGSSNWTNDEKGNLVFEASDGLTAMMLSGRGLGLANGKTEDSIWDWTTAITGYGINANVINAGFISAERIEAKSLTVEKLASNVGAELDISSNVALNLYATLDGSKPAGALKTTDAQIIIAAGKQEGGTTIPARIDILSGGELDIHGASVNITADSSSNGTIVIGQAGNEFIIGASNNDAFIRNGLTGINDTTHTGVYFGTDGFALRQKDSNNIVSSIIANNGTIKVANWIIANSQLESGSGTGFVAINSDATLTNPSLPYDETTNDYVQPYAIWCGSQTESSAPFRVSRTGDVYLNRLMIMNPATHQYVAVDFSGDFEHAISVSDLSGWDGHGNLMLRYTFFNKVEAETETGITATIDVGTLSYNPVTHQIQIPVQVYSAVSGGTEELANETTAYLEDYAGSGGAFDAGVQAAYAEIATQENIYEADYSTYVDVSGVRYYALLNNNPISVVKVQQDQTTGLNYEYCKKIY